jgi:hypothetical protein
MGAPEGSLVTITAQILTPQLAGGRRGDGQLSGGLGTAARTAAGKSGRMP